MLLAGEMLVKVKSSEFKRDAKAKHAAASKTTKAD
jgi:hypothetical protein